MAHGMVKETTSGSTRADVTARMWRERVRVLASVNGRPVDIHGWCSSITATGMAASYGTEMRQRYILVGEESRHPFVCKYLLYVFMPCEIYTKPCFMCAQCVFIIPQLYDAQG